MSMIMHPRPPIVDTDFDLDASAIALMFMAAGRDVVKRIHKGSVKIPRFPPEIYHSIISHLRLSKDYDPHINPCNSRTIQKTCLESLCNLCMVSREFYSLASLTLYSVVDLLVFGGYHERNVRAAAKIKLFYRTVKSNPKLALFVKSLAVQVALKERLEYIEEHWEVEEYAKLAIGKLPSLAHLHVVTRRLSTSRPEKCRPWLSECARGLRELSIDFLVDGKALNTLLSRNPALRFLSVASVVTDSKFSMLRPHQGLTALELASFDSYNFERSPWNMVSCLSISVKVADIPFLPQLANLKFCILMPDPAALLIFQKILDLCTKTPNLKFIHVVIKDHYRVDFHHTKELPAQGRWTNWESLRVFVWEQNGITDHTDPEDYEDHRTQSLMPRYILEAIPNPSYLIFNGDPWSFPRLFFRRSPDGRITERELRNHAVDPFAWRYVTREGELPLGVISQRLY